MSAPHEGTTLKQQIPKQQQELPGLQKDMEPEPFDTSLETASGPKQYTGIGKLKGKKALITGGECVKHGCSPHQLATDPGLQLWNWPSGRNSVRA